MKNGMSCTLLFWKKCLLCSDKSDTMVGQQAGSAGIAHLPVGKLQCRKIAADFVFSAWDQRNNRFAVFCQRFWDAAVMVECITYPLGCIQCYVRTRWQVVVFIVPATASFCFLSHSLSLCWPFCYMREREAGRFQFPFQTLVELQPCRVGLILGMAAGQ